MSNSNINQNAIQIVFPNNMELRQIKKKKKRKSPSANKKKSLIKLLKELLEAYDQEISVAKSKNISLPADLGELPNDIKNMKSVKQLEILIDEMKSKILKIQELIKNGDVSNRSNNLFGVAPRPMAIGSFPIPQQPATIQPFQIQPVPIPVQPVKNDIGIGNKLDSLENEILKNLDPNDEATKKILEQIRERKQQTLPVDPNRPLPETPIVNPGSQIPGGFVMVNNLLLSNGNRINFIAPIGFADFYERYNEYVKNTLYDTQEIIPTVYHIHLAQIDGLEKERTKIQSDFVEYLKTLSKDKVDFLTNNKNKTVSTLYNEMYFNLGMPPEQMAKKILLDNGKKVKEITAGNQPTSISTRIKNIGVNTNEMPFVKTEDNAAWKKFIAIYYDIQSNGLLNIRKRLDQIQLNQSSGIPPKENELDKLGKQINKMSFKLNKVYQQSSSNVKVGITGDNDKLKRELNNQRQRITDIRQPMSASKPIPPTSPINPTDLKNIEKYITKQPNFKKFNSIVSESVKNLYGEAFYNSIKTKQAEDKRLEVEKKYNEHNQRRMIPPTAQFIF